jgi:hypothetical protein
MQPDRRAGCVEQVWILGCHGSTDPGQNVPCPGAGQPVRSRAGNAGPAIRRSDDGIGTLQDDDLATRGRSGPRSIDLAALEVTEKTTKLPFMGGEDDPRRPAGKNREVKAGQGIGIED